MAVASRCSPVAIRVASRFNVGRALVDTGSPDTLVPSPTEFCLHRNTLNGLGWGVLGFFYNKILQKISPKSPTQQKHAP
jgi:hypothetical protein